MEFNKVRQNFYLEFNNVILKYTVIKNIKKINIVG